MCENLKTYVNFSKSVDLFRCLAFHLRLILAASLSKMRSSSVDHPTTVGLGRPPCFDPIVGGPFWVGTRVLVGAEFRPKMYCSHVNSSAMDIIGAGNQNLRVVQIFDTVHIVSKPILFLHLP